MKNISVLLVLTLSACSTLGQPAPTTTTSITTTIPTTVIPAAPNPVIVTNFVTVTNYVSATVTAPPMLMQVEVTDSQSRFVRFYGEKELAEKMDIKSILPKLAIQRKGGRAKKTAASKATNATQVATANTAVVAAAPLSIGAAPNTQTQHIPIGATPNVPLVPIGATPNIPLVANP
ncbi:MAG: hypothetical protein NUV53_00775 [Patescibacteria group bacterium]|nr:hypothetical protein [Patescibacteria group bacterium]